MAAIESLTTDAIQALVTASSYPPVFLSESKDLATSGETHPIDVTQASMIRLQLKNTGSAAMAAGVFAFEASVDSTDGIDGTWVTQQMTRSNDNTIETTRPTASLAAGAAQAYSWEASVVAYSWFRVRCTTTVTASAIATWTAGKSAEPVEPIPAIGAVVPSAYSLVSAATTNAASIKTTAGMLYELTVFNATAAVIYVKLYNKASAPTVGTDVPVFSFPVVVNGGLSLSFGGLGKRFTTGIALATTLGPLATDVAAIAVGAQIHCSYI